MPQSPLAFVAQNARSNAIQPGASGQQKELFVGQRHAPNYESAYARIVGMACNVGGVTTSVGLATTYVGLCLSNPAGSGKNLSLITVSGALLVAPSTITSFRLIAGFAAGGITVHTTPLTPANGLIGTSPTGLVGLVDAACTLVGTPAWARVLGMTPTDTTSLAFSHAIDGSILIPPGGYVAIGTDIAGPASGFLGSMIWAENPV